MDNDELVRKSTSLIDELRTQGYSPPEIAEIMICALTILNRFCGLHGIEQCAENIRREMIDMDKHFEHPSENLN